MDYKSKSTILLLLVILSLIIIGIPSTIILISTCHLLYSYFNGVPELKSKNFGPCSSTKLVTWLILLFSTIWLVIGFINMIQCVVCMILYNLMLYRYYVYNLGYEFIRMYMKRSPFCIAHKNKYIYIKNCTKDIYNILVKQLVEYDIDSKICLLNNKLIELLEKIPKVGIYLKDGAAKLDIMIQIISEIDGDDLIKYSIGDEFNQDKPRENITNYGINLDKSGNIDLQKEMEQLLTQSLKMPQPTKEEIDCLLNQSLNLQNSADVEKEFAEMMNFLAMMNSSKKDM